MINYETKRKLNELNLNEIVDALEAQSKQSLEALSFDERMQLLVDYVYQEKYTNKDKVCRKMWI